MVGVNIGFGKRLNWPDDYFTFTAELGYNWYYLKNWEYLYYMNNGTSNAIVLGLTLARSSIDNPLYTRSGSSFSLNLQLTPPASLFSGHKDWEKTFQGEYHGLQEGAVPLDRILETAFQVANIYPAG